MSGFQPVPDSERVIQHPSAPREASVGLQIVLAALSQKLGAFATAIFTLLTVGSVWWLWLVSPSDPSVKTLVGLGMYALFILALHVIRGKQK